MESSSPPTGAELPADDRTERLFIVNMICIYRQAALAQIAEAEDAIARGIELREHALGLLDRAAKLAFDYARLQEYKQNTATVIPDEDDIAF